MEFLKLLLTKDNLLKMCAAAGAGAVIGVASTGLLQATASDLPEEYEFLRHDQEVLEYLQDLRQLLLLSSKNLVVFYRLCSALNVLVGYDHLIDTGTSFRLDLNYTIQALQHACNRDMALLLKAPCRIPAVAVELCSLVEKLQEKITNVAYNMNQEIRLRIMDSRF